MLPSLALAALLGPPPSPPPSGEAAERPDVPDLGMIRYRDPRVRRAVWLGLDVGGAVVPARLGLFNRTVWTVHTTPTWALALTPWLAVGARHGLTWYDAQNIRLRVHSHQAEISGQPLFNSPVRGQDRLALGVDFHRIDKTKVGDLDLRLGGVQDLVAHVGYGIDHDLGRRWRLGWRAQIRHAWVQVATQRQLRLSLRPAFLPRPGHRLAAEGLLFVVHRDRDQAGNLLPRTGAYGQVAAEYAWLSRIGVGIEARIRYLSSFFTGEAPIYEIREESLNTSYGEVIVGLRAVWR